jgi:SAM-dependent methyltransferase
MTFNPLYHENTAKDDTALAGLARQRRDECPWGCAVAVEVGAWAGHSTLILAELGYTVFAVDHWQGGEGDRIQAIAQLIGIDKGFKTFCENMGTSLLSTVFPLRGSSELIASVWPRNRPIDLCFIDADHRYNSALQDIQIWTRLMRKGGLMIGHDYSDFFPGVVLAVEDTGPFQQAGDSIWYRRIE